MPMGYLIGWEPLPYGNSAVQHAEMAVLRSSSHTRSCCFPLLLSLSCRYPGPLPLGSWKVWKQAEPPSSRWIGFHNRNCLKGAPAVLSAMRGAGAPESLFI